MIKVALLMTALIGPTVHAESTRLPNLDAYNHCKFFVEESRLNCMEEKGNGTRTWPIKVSGDAATRIRLMQKAMEKASFGFHSQPVPNVVNFVRVDDIGD